jgi:serine/threonine protein phosphatase PrpC
VVRIEIGVVSLPYRAGSGGDACLVKEAPGKILLAVVDGLGHGQLARYAATRAIEIIESSPCFKIDELLDIVHSALKNTVGVVMGLALIDQEKGLLTCSGVGNVIIKIVGSNKIQIRLPEGILGYRMIKKFSRELPITPDDVLIMHTDGIRDDYEPEPLLLPFPGKLARALAAGYRNLSDDALVLVAADLLSKKVRKELSDESF